MIDFKDEILAGEPKYIIRNANNEIIIENASIDMTTPVIQEATNLDRATFTNIKDNVQLIRRYNIINASKLSDEYDGVADDMFRFDLHPYVAIPSPTGSLNPFGSYGYGNYKVYAQYESGTGSGSHVENIFDGNDSTSRSNIWQSYVNDLFYYYFEYPTPIMIKKIKIVAGSAYTHIYVGGSNDGINYTEIQDIADVGASGEATLANSAFYKYYRLGLNVYGMSQPTRSLYTIEFTSIYGNMEKYNLLESDLHVLSYENNMRVLIEPYEIASGYANYFKFSGLPPKLIVGTIEDGKRYELTYDGVVFNAKEVE